MSDRAGKCPSLFREVIEDAGAVARQMQSSQATRGRRGEVSAGKREVVLVTLAWKRVWHAG